MPLGAHKATLFGVAGVSTGDVVLLSTQTASDSASLDFTSGIDSTYGEYIFKFYNINPATDLQEWSFQGSIDGGSNYNVAMTSTSFRASHSEADDYTDLSYQTGMDQAQGTAFNLLAADIGGGGDESGAGELYLFNPSNTTYVKHWYCTMVYLNGYDLALQQFSAGYFNTTDNIDAIQFKFASGNFDGTIKMWGVKN